jgi:hypothetical protein
METHSYIRQFILKDSSTLLPGKRPTVSLVVLVKPGDTQVSQVFDNVVPHVDEVVLITVDASSEDIKRMLGNLVFQGRSVNHVEVNVARHPELYFKDVPESYSVGTPLDNEIFSGPFSGRSLIADWSKVRNLGWKRCSQEWRVMLDGDDMMISPAYIRSVCDVMNECGILLGYSSYIRPSRGLSGEVAVSSLMGRIARNGGDVHWVGEARENLEGGYRSSVIEGSMVVVKSAATTNTESEIEQFKVLYAHARRNNWEIAPCNLLYMAKLSSLVGMQGFAESAITAYLATSLYTEERAWACALRGEMFESEGHYDMASYWYGKSMAEHPGFKSAYRLCRSSFREQKWQACLDAFQVGIENDEFVHMVDDGDEDKTRAFILAAASLAQLGRMEEAKSCGEILLQLFPKNETVQRMCEALK